MTSKAQTLSHAAHIAPRSSTGGVVGGLWNAFWSRRARSATVHILRGLDDRTLHDIGIQRSEIDSVVYGNPGDRLRHFRAQQQ